MTLTRAKEIKEAKEQYGVDGAAEKLNISRETVRRACRQASNTKKETESPDIVPSSTVLDQISKRYSPTELKLLAYGGLPMEYKHTPVHNFTGKTIKIGWLGDTHIGSVYTDYSRFKDVLSVFKREKVDLIAHTGDVTEGMSNRPGHIYECSELGFDAQKEKAIEILKRFDFCPLYMIDGNHDRWYIKSNGAFMVKEICAAIPNASFLGHDEGDVLLGQNCRLKLWHGEDSSSYALSYRLQKLVESLPGGDKPNIMLCGHTHKFVQIMERNIHCIGTGCIQKQSKWMRGKRLAAHCGFGVTKVAVNEKGIGRISNEWFPFYA